MREVLFIIVVTLLLQRSCNTVPRPASFFPIGAFDECIYRETDPEKMRLNGNYHAAWIEKRLTSFGEPSLYQLSSDSSRESYRFLWLRSFDRTIAIRVDIRDRKNGLVTVKGAKVVDSKPIVLSELRPLVLGEEDIATFHKILDSQGYWKLHPCEELTGIDGSVWVLEGLLEGKYKVVARRGESAEFRPLIEHLIQMADLKSEQFY